MPTIKERFKSGFKKAGEKIESATIGSPGDRAYRAEQKARQEDAYWRGREKGAVQGAYQRGYKEGKAKSQNRGGFFGSMEAIGKGLEAGLNAGVGTLGMDDFQTSRRSKPQPHRKQTHRKKRKRQSHRSHADYLLE